MKYDDGNDPKYGRVLFEAQSMYDFKVSRIRKEMAEVVKHFNGSGIANAIGSVSLYDSVARGGSWASAKVIVDYWVEEGYLNSAFHYQGGGWPYKKLIYWIPTKSDFDYSGWPDDDIHLGETDEDGNVKKQDIWSLGIDNAAKIGKPEAL